LFADERTIGLGVQAKVVVRNLFREINQALGTTILLTSHDMGDVEALAERVVIVAGGRAAFDGDLAGLRTRADLPKHAVSTYRDGHVERVRLGDEAIGDLVQAASRSGERRCDVPVRCSGAWWVRRSR
jgi:ABC-2 type transport system ATP-binding protein